MVTFYSNQLCWMLMLRMPWSKKSSLCSQKQTTLWWKRFHPKMKYSHLYGQSTLMLLQVLMVKPPWSTNTVGIYLETALQKLCKLYSEVPALPSHREHPSWFMVPKLTSLQIPLTQSIKGEFPYSTVISKSYLVLTTAGLIVLLHTPWTPTNYLQEMTGGSTMAFFKARDAIIVANSKE